jgi:hypothetical protein
MRFHLSKGSHVLFWKTNVIVRVCPISCMAIIGGLCIAFDVLDFLLLQPACIHNFSFIHVANKTSIHSLIYLHEVYTCVAEI